MKLMTRFIATTILFIGISHSAAAQTAEDIVDKYLRAVGGLPALAKLESRHIVGTLSMSTPVGMISGSAEVFSQAPNKQRSIMKLDLSQLRMGQVTIDQRFNGESAYVMDPMQGNREITGNMLDNMKNAAFPSPFVGYKE